MYVSERKLLDFYKHNMNTETLISCSPTFQISLWHFIFNASLKEEGNPSVFT